MRFCADYGTDAPLYLVSAILLYGSKDALYGNDKIRLGTVHTPEPNPAGGPPILGEGQPVSKSFLEALSRSLQSELPRCLAARKRFGLVAASCGLVGAASYPCDVL